MSADSRPSLLRAVGRWDWLAINLNIIIGAGIFGLPATVFGLLGAWSPLAYLICALNVALIVLCFAEVASRFMGTGGAYLYAREAFGPSTGLSIGWISLVAGVTALAANAALLMEYAAYFVPAVGAGPGRAVLLTLVFGLLTWINVRGVKYAAWASDAFTIAKILPLLLLIVAGLPAASHWRPHGAALPAGHDVGRAAMYLVYAFGGFELTVIPSGEAREPRRDLPRALLVSLLITAVLYSLIQVVVSATLGAQAGTRFPLALTAQQLLGPAGGAIVAAGAIILMSGNLEGQILTRPRQFFAMAEDGYLPDRIAAVHPRYRTPYVAVIVYSVLSWLLALSGTFIWIAGINVISRLVTYIATCVAAPVLRRQPAAPAAGFLLPGGPLIPLGAMGLSLWLLAQSTWRDALLVIAALVIGFVITAVIVRSRAQTRSAIAAGGPTPPA